MELPLPCARRWKHCFTTRKLLNPTSLADLEKNNPSASLDFRQTPRTEYASEKAFKTKIAYSLILQLKNEQLESLRQTFEEASKNLSALEFVKIVKLYVIQTSTTNVKKKMWGTAKSKDDFFTECLVEVFDDIDVNSNGQISWNEFTEYLVDVAGSQLHIDNHSQFARLFCDYGQKSKVYNAPITFVKYFQGLDRVIVFEENLPYFKIFHKNLRLQKIAREGHRGEVIDGIYDSDQQKFITSSVDCSIAFWDTSPKAYFNLLKKWDVAKPQVLLALSGGGKTLYSAPASQGTILSWNVEINEIKKKISNVHNDIITCMICLNETLVTSSLDCTLKVFELLNGDLVQTLNAKDKVLCLASSSECSYIISGGCDNFVLIWDETKLLNSSHDPLVRELSLESSGIIALDTIPNSDNLVVCDQTGVFYIYSLKNFSLIQRFTRGMGPEQLVGKAIDPSAKLRGYAANLKGFTVFEDEITSMIAYTDKQLWKFDRVSKNNPKQESTAVVFAIYNPLSLTFLTATQTKIRIWNALTGKFVHEYKIRGDSPITCGCFDSRYRRIFVGTHDGQIQVFNFSNGSFMNKLDSHGAEVTNLKYSNKTKTIISTSWDDTVVIHTDPGEKDLRSTESRN